MEIYYRQSKSIKGLKRMIVRIKHNCSNLYIPYIRVILDSDANASPYTRTSQKTLERQRTLLTQGHSVHETYDLLIKESGGPYASSSQSAGPCNKCQLYNVNLKRRRQSKSNDASDVGDYLSSLLRDLRSMDVVETIITKKHC